MNVKGAMGMKIEDIDYDDIDFDQIYICHKCFKDIDIKKYIKDTGDFKHLCSICGNAIETVNYRDKNIVRMVRALIRYNYPEYIYNCHWGGDLSAYELLTVENSIIHNPYFKNGNDQDKFDTIMEELVGGVDKNHEIPLYAGHTDAGRDLFPLSMRTQGTSLFNELLTKLKSSNYNELLERYEKSFNKIIDNWGYEIEKGRKLFRARIGYNILTEKSEEFEHDLKRKIPFSGNEIAAPPPIKASPGRANRESISYYYLASDINTAIAEVRPHPGHYVTVADFEVNEDIRVVNLINSKLFQNSFSEKEMEDYIFFKELSMEFEKPLTPDINNRYYVSQFISDIFKRLGYGGIIFNSSVSTGKNIVIFDKKKIIETSKENELFKILKQTYRIGKVSHSRDYFMDSYDEVVSE